MSQEEEKISSECEIRYSDPPIVEVTTLTVSRGEMSWISSEEKKRYRLSLKDVSVMFQTDTSEERMYSFSLCVCSKQKPKRTLCVLSFKTEQDSLRLFKAIDKETNRRFKKNLLDAYTWLGNPGWRPTGRTFRSTSHGLHTRCSLTVLT